MYVKARDAEIEELASMQIELLGQLNKNETELEEVSEQSERALRKTSILVMNPAKWLQT